MADSIQEIVVRDREKKTEIKFNNIKAVAK